MEQYAIEFEYHTASYVHSYTYIIRFHLNFMVKLLSSRLSYN